MSGRQTADDGGNDPLGIGLPVRRLTIPEEGARVQLEPTAREGFDRLVAWLRQRERPEGGIRVLFYGPRGSGKTLAAALLGQAAGLPAYRIDLAAIISKYIGETEKNLARLLDQAGQEDWILFCDETDALLDQPSAVDDGGERRGRRSVSNLWRRIENYPGLVILASHRDADPDETLSQRVRWVIHFSVPKPAPG
jgi:SpoVK/Ycf46/Vps4 family AAA+-type ATPase